MKPTSSPLRSFKSKKIVQSSSKSASSSCGEISASDPNTPEKPIQPRQRVRNQSVALSVKDVRKVAQGLRKSGREPTESSKQPSKKSGFGPSSDLAEKSRKDANVTAAVATPIKLPEKYEILAKFFDSMECSIRLLKLKGITRTFTNISRGVESLMDRRFSYNHLAQLKHILPEVIVVEKVLSRDEQTLCMKPDLQITLQVDAIENNLEDRKGSGYTNLRKLFRSRLLDFRECHPEVDDIPEETLPEPFNQSKQNVILTTIPTSIPPLTVGSSSSDVLTEQNSVVASHLSRSFQRRFAGKVPIPESEKSQLLSTSCEPSPFALAISVDNSSCNGTSSSAVISPIKPSSKLPIVKGMLSSDASPIKLHPSASVGNGDDAMRHMEKKYFQMENDQPQGTPAKAISTPVRLMTSTPDLQTPKRCRISQDDDITVSPNKLLRRPPRNRPLFQTPVKNKKAKDEVNNLGSSPVDADIVKLLPETLLESIREKERKATEENDIGISLAKRRRQMMACLPKLFNMIHLIFQSANRSILTKEELIHKTITSHCDIVDRDEIEEQLKLLLELVPDWISQKVGYSGDLLLSINKTFSPDLIRRTLAEAL